MKAFSAGTSTVLHLPSDGTSYFTGFTPLESRTEDYPKDAPVAFK